MEGWEEESGLNHLHSVGIYITPHVILAPKYKINLEIEISPQTLTE